MKSFLGEGETRSRGREVDPRCSFMLLKSKVRLLVGYLGGIKRSKERSVLSNSNVI